MSIVSQMQVISSCLCCQCAVSCLCIAMFLCRVGLLRAVAGARGHAGSAAALCRFQDVLLRAPWNTVAVLVMANGLVSAEYGWGASFHPCLCTNSLVALTTHQAVPQHRENAPGVAHTTSSCSGECVRCYHQHSSAAPVSICFGVLGDGCFPGRSSLILLLALPCGLGPDDDAAGQGMATWMTAAAGLAATGIPFLD